MAQLAQCSIAPKLVNYTAPTLMHIKQVLYYISIILPIVYIHQHIYCDWIYCDIWCKWTALYYRVILFCAILTAHNYWGVRGGREDNVLIILHYNTPSVDGELIYNKLVFMWQSKHTLTHISCIIELRISITQIIRLILW